jgi:SAM-dependent methyltransferase
MVMTMEMNLTDAERLSRKDRLDLWGGDFGTAYHKANPFLDASVKARTKWLCDIVLGISYRYSVLGSILEVGCGKGENLAAWKKLTPRAPIEGIEPNAYAAGEARKLGFPVFQGTATDFVNSDHSNDTFDLVMASGVLIHVPTAGLEEIMTAMYQLSGRYILSAEYFSFREQEMPYREPGACWSRPYGDIWMDLFNLRPVKEGYLWHRTTGLDNLIWHLFEKV